MFSLRPPHSLTRRSFLRASAVGALALAAAPKWTPASQTSAARQSGTEQGVAGPLTNLLSLTPDLTSVPSPPRIITTFADPLAQYTALGLPPITGPDDDLLRQIPFNPLMLPIEYPDSMVRSFLRETWEPVFGFNPFQIKQSLVVGDYGADVVVLRGQFHTGAISTALRLNTYTAMKFGDIQGFVFGELERLDPASPVRQLWLTGAEYIGIIDEETLIFAREPEAIIRFSETINGANDALVSSPEVATLLMHIGDRPLVSARIARGEALTHPYPRREGNAHVAFPTPGAEEMPAPRLVLLASTVGLGKIDMEDMATALAEVAAVRPDVNPPAQLPEGRLRIVLNYEDAASAELAAEIADERLATGSSIINSRPWTEHFASWEITIDHDHAAIVIELVGAEVHAGYRGRRAFEMGDLGFIAP